jgi:pimeloyl-ACP methyl ester carboxylesterase
VGRDIVLVHGMSHGAWCWDLLVPRLQRTGHRVLAVDLPGHGRRAHEWRRASMARYARSVADDVIAAGLHSVLLVGHSMAGAVIPKVAELIPQRVGHLVFLAAVVPVSGATLLETQMTPGGRALMRGLAAAGHGAIQYPAAVEHARWLGDVPAGDPILGQALAQMTPQPLRPWTERLDLSRFHALRLPRTYIRCLHDAAIPPARAAEYAARLGVTPIDLDTAHGPMLSAPDALARVLESL